MTKKMEDSLVCPICVDFAEDAHTTLCCSQVYCGACIVCCTDCPTCRSSPVKHTANPFVDRLIGKIETECLSCNAKIDRIDLTQHQLSCRKKTTTCPDCSLRLDPSLLASHTRKCPQRMIQCPSKDCNTSHPGSSVLLHIAFEHPDIVNFASLENIAKVLVVDDSGGGELACPKHRCPFVLTPQDLLLHIVCDHAKDVSLGSITQASKSLLNMEVRGESASFIDPTATIVGDAKIMRLGKTGKYYCGQAIWFSTQCTCCEGNCGTMAGSNCKTCMRQDLVTRRLPQGYLVNSDGFPARKGAGGLFYCGRRVPELVKSAGCDGWCGPTNGPNCLSCQCLDRCATHAYKTLL
ncbi:UNVERIFIED_CONTAM: hypothetical protein HDU68_002509 [Siphonaria sp. JEL0065]|nr:hypothetical protein HDU68_002509 [Siphonaria sp. JEL0065]